MKFAVNCGFSPAPVHSGEMKDGVSKGEIAGLIEESGMIPARFVDTSASLDEIMAAAGRSPHADSAVCAELTAAPAVVMTGLYHGNGENTEPGPDHLSIAPFARSHHYREAARRLGRIAGILAARTGASKSLFRVFCNSRMPEKPLGMLCGIGFAGRNSLLIRPGSGSLWIIAGMTLPFRIEPDPPAAPPPPRFDGCEGCSRCIDACPTGAIAAGGGIDTERCIQAWTERLDPVPDDIADLWGTRLYGCQTCQDVCPYNAGLPVGPSIPRGRIGPSLAARTVLEAGLSGAGAVDALFRGTVLGQGFIDPMALVRNALISVGNTNPPGIERLLAEYAVHPVPEIGRMAERAIRRTESRYRY